jgi:hydrogenase maturation factor
MIEFTLGGKKLKGDYVLIHTGENKWLFFKKKQAEV